jgi:hypothetical protein
MPAEIEAGEVFHKHEWLIQRIGWGLLSLILMAAVLGVFGSGPVARTAIASGDDVLEFERFSRRHAPTQWTIMLAPSERAGVFSVRISSSFLERYRISAIVPEPRGRSLTRSDVAFEFDISDPAAAIVFHVEPERSGSSEGFFRLGNAEPIRVEQFIYP